MIDGETVLENAIALRRATRGTKKDVTRGRSLRSKTMETPPVMALVSSNARTLRAWLDEPDILRPPGVVIPLLAVEGRVTLLSGREKIGKSTLAAGSVAAASVGTSLFAAPLSGVVNTLWYALDEPVADAVRRFQTLSADLDRVVINDAPRSKAELFAALEHDLVVFPDVRLVVVDTLSRVLAMSSVDPNSSREVEPVMAQLVDFFHGHGVAAVLLYHTNKGGKDYRGSTAIGATVDEILTLRRRGQADEDDFDDEHSDDGRRLLVQDGRNLRGRVHLTCADGTYRLYEQTEPARARIIGVLRERGSVANRSELARLAGVQKARALTVIADLIAEGAVHVGDGRALALAISEVTKLG